ncbi:MAG: D-alanyl-D-alanine carboxypeptidase, partial [Patescibacteria group bacterium]
GSRVGLFNGEDLSFRSLLYGMLLNSGNDAAFTLAENYPGGILGFVSAMNKKVLELGLQNTHFDNPAGFDSPNHYSSASDLAKITQEALKDSTLTRIFATKETNIVSLDKKYTHQLFNLNKLLEKVRGVVGVKTGTTEEAKENLVTLVERDGRKILLVVLGSNDRFLETTRLIDWVDSNFAWAEI